MTIKKYLKIDKAFVPVSEDDGDEFFQNGIFTFNITKMLSYIKNNPEIFIPEKINVNDHTGHFSSIDEEYIGSVTNTDPIILAEISPGLYTVIDGNHRMEKARRSGIEHIMGYKINAEEHIKFLTT